LGLVIGAAGMFRYQETAHLARQAARYASTHGTQWAKDTGNPPASPADIYTNAIVPSAVALDLSKLNYGVSYNNLSNAPTPTQTSIVNGDIVATRNTVTITVTYQWVPEAFLGGVTLSSTSVMPMSN
jgi:hypothetical protein